MMATKRICRKQNVTTTLTVKEGSSSQRLKKRLKNMFTPKLWCEGGRGDSRGRQVKTMPQTWTCLTAHIRCTSFIVLYSLAIPDNWRSPHTNRLGTSKCKAVAGIVVRTAANKATPLTFLKRRCLPGNSALWFFFSVGKQTSNIASHFVRRRELFITSKWMHRATLDYLITPHQLCCVHIVPKARHSSHITLLL